MADPDSQRLFNCSFCGKVQTEVRKLIFGPGVAICDECVGLCLPIVADTSTAPTSPDRLRTPDKSTTEQLHSILKGYNGAFESIDRAMQDVVDILREREISWAAIGETLGVSRQAAWKRFG